MSQKRLFVVDAMAMAFRNFHAFARPLTTSTGMPTQAVYGSLNFLWNLIEKEKPDYLVIATDSVEKTFRHELYSEYKANRTDMPEDLAVQIPYLYQLFEAIGCNLLKVPGLEADDLIGSLVKQWASEDLDCYIVSGDKDFMQLVNHHVFLYSPKKGGDVVITDEAGVINKFGVPPLQVIEILALMGDSADHVPGVRGIGEKGAIKLIQSYGNLEGIYENLDLITNKRLRESLESNRDMAFLSRELVTIKVDAELPFTLESSRCHLEQALASPKLLELTTELEFRTLRNKVEARLKKVAATKQPELASKTSVATPENSRYQLVTEREEFQTFLNRLAGAKSFCFDTETTGLDIVQDQPIGISFSWQAGEAYYIPFIEKHLKSLSFEEIFVGLQPFLTNQNLKKIGHNVKFDLQMLRNKGFLVDGPFYDTMIASYLLNSTERSHSLDACCLRFLNYEKIKTESVWGEGKSMLNADLDQLSHYACEDADYTFRLYEYLDKNLDDERLRPVFEDIEMPLVPVIAQMEQNGVFIDTQMLESLSWKLSQRGDELEKLICQLAGETFNIKSTKQLQFILFEKLKIHESLGVKRLKKTKSGFSTDVSVLERLREHPLVEALLEYRTVTKLKSTYVDTLPQLIDPKTHRIHTSFHQTGTATGRLSSSDPNLQNIPIRTELGREIRKAFRPESDQSVIISADYSQIELRILAHLSSDENLKEAFIEGQDIHSSTAARIFGVKESEVTSNQRSQAKAINFGIIYGMGAQRLARETGVSMKEAKDFIDRYFASYPKIKTYIDQSIQFAKEHGYTLTMTGRKRPLQDIHSQDRVVLANAQNIAVNSPVQGSAADLIKKAMVEIQKKLDDSGLDVKMLLQVHDELVFECSKGDLDKAEPLIKHSMEQAMAIGVPIRVDIGHGNNWLEAH